MMDASELCLFPSTQVVTVVAVEVEEPLLATTETVRQLVLLLGTAAAAAAAAAVLPLEVGAVSEDDFALPLRATSSSSSSSPLRLEHEEGPLTAMRGTVSTEIKI